jgi:release factor glutamine methyltransferase
VTIAELLSAAAGQLQGISDSPRLDAEVLLCHVLQQPRSYLFSWPDRALEPIDRQAFQALLQQRLGGTPVAHLTGSREFWSLELEVNPDTLIPRPDTELLVDTLLQTCPADETLQLADLGTGSGAIACALASERPGWHIVATDQSAAALDMARRNAARLGLDNIEFRLGHWCQALGEQRFHAIVSNPPYIPTADPHLQQGDVRFEPRSALAAGDDGLDDIREICACARQHLLPCSLLLLEHGYDQQLAVAEIFTRTGFKQLRQYRDLAQNPRATSGIFN